MKGKSRKIKGRSGPQELDALFNKFLAHLEKDSIYVIQDSIRVNAGFIHNRIKSGLAGSLWGKDEGANIRLLLDNQVIEALKHFNEADAFIESLN